MALAANPNAHTQAREIAWQALTELDKRLASRADGDKANAAHQLYAAQRIERFLKDPKEIPMPKPVEAPPGQPIGCDWN